MNNYTDAMMCISDELQNEEIRLSLDEAGLKDYKKYKESGQLKEELFQELTIQFLFFLSYNASGPNGVVFLTRNSILPFYSRGRFYGLLYRDCFVYFVYLQDTYENRISFQRRFWKRLFNDVSILQEQQSFKCISEGKNSICNRIPQEFNGIYDLEQVIENCMKVDFEHGNSIEKELFMPRKTLECFFSIKSYIMSVFAFIEYLGNCLLPFWEADPNNKCYKYFVDSCNDKNKSINSWKDLLDEGKNDPQTYGYRTWETTQPRRIETINLIIDTINFIYSDSQHGYINDEYHSLKSAYRNMLTHGSMGIHFFYGFSDGEVNLNSNHTFTEGKPNNHMIEIDYHAYKRVQKYYRVFLGTVKHLFPKAFRYIFSGLDIPTDLTEYFKICDDDAKTDAYISILNARGVMDSLKYLFDKNDQPDEKKQKYTKKALKIMHLMDESIPEDGDDEVLEEHLVNYYRKQAKILGISFNEKDLSFKTTQ